MTNGLDYPIHLETDPAERAVIALALLSPTLADRLIVDEQLTPTLFLNRAHADAWNAITDLRADDQPLDAITLAARMTTKDAAQTLGSCLTTDHNVSGLKTYLQILRDGRRRHGYQQAAIKLAQAAATGDENTAAQAERHLHAPTGQNLEDTAAPEQVGHHLIDYLQSTTTVAIPTGFPRLDNGIGGGFRQGDITAIGGWTGMGKTVLVDQLLTHAHLEGYRCHAYVNEMSVVDRGLRMLARATRIPHHRLLHRDLHHGEHTRVLDAASRMPFGISDCSQWSAEQIARHIRTHRWDLCVLDLLHNIPYDGEGELHRITATLAAAARTSGTHLLLVCQLNEERAKSDKLPTPVIRDIRGSGMIKNITATVLFVHRFQTSDHGVVFTTNETAIYAAKARHGQVGCSVDAVFNPDRMLFEAAVPHLKEAVA